MNKLAMFITSKGPVVGYIYDWTHETIIDSKTYTVTETVFQPSDKGAAIIRLMYIVEDNDMMHMPIEGAWVKIPLSDGYYGYPEYKLHISEDET